MVILFLFGISLVPHDGNWENQLRWEEQYALIGEINSGEFPPEFIDQPLDLNRASVEDLRRLSDLSYGGIKDELEAIKRNSLTNPSWSSNLIKKIRWNHPLEVAEEYTSPFVVKVRLKADQRWGGDTPANPLGPPFGSTERVVGTWRNWRAGVVLDRDRYERNVADLNRFWLHYTDSTLACIAGDFTARIGEGGVFWTAPSYFSPEGVTGESRVTTPQIAPGSNSRQNAATRGVAGSIRYHDWSALIAGGSTRLDATVSNDGRRLHLSDGGLHRTTGESAKRESIREDLVAAGLQRDFQWEKARSNIGASLWWGRLTPPLNPDRSIDDSFSLAGSDVGAYGVFGAHDYENGDVSFENSWDIHGIPAQRGRVALIIRPYSETHESRDLAINSISSPEATVWIAGYRCPPNYQNPHARSLAGRGANNLQGMSFSTELRHWNRLNYIHTTVGVEERIWRTSLESSPPVYSYGIIESEFSVISWKGRLRLTRRNGNDPDYDAESNAIASSRYGVTRIRYSAAGPWGRSFICAAKPDYLLQFWIEAAHSDEKAGRIGAAGAVALRKSMWMLKHRSRVAFGVKTFTTPTALPIYSADVAPPDIFSTVRLAGTGVRVWGELRIEVDEKGAFLMRCARVIPIGGGAKASGALYLTFNRTWGGGKF